MNKEDLQNEIENYLHYYYGIKKSFDIYKYIKENSEVYSIETQNIAYFLHPVLVSLLNSVLLDISKILDKRNQKNLNKLLDKCIANVKLFCDNPNSLKERKEKLEQFNAIKSKLENNEPLIEKLKKYRDVYLAHTDEDYFMNPKKLFEECATTYDDIENILKLMVESLNKLLYSLCQTTYAFNEAYKRDYQYILECIKEHREKRIKR